MIKWMAFIASLWFIGVIFGSYYEGQTLDTYHPRQMVTSEGETENMTAEATFEYLLDFTGSEAQGDTGGVFYKLGDFDYYRAWMQMLLFDFTFLKDYDSGTGEFNETIASYFFKLIGTIGLLAFILTFIAVIQSFVPG